jgi:outer membrane immunogenic protein
MSFWSFGRAVSAPRAMVLALVLGAPGAASAHDWFRVPDLMPAASGSLHPIDRTGFILSPDFEFSDEVNLGGSGGALLQDTEGFSLGAKLGYDKQFGNVVLGAVADGLYSFADGGGKGAGAGKYKSELDFYGTIRGRLGYSLGRFMPYGTAGFAYGQLEVKNIQAGVSDTELMTGWVYGGGLEFVYNNDITLHAGYRRIDFGNQSFTSLPGGQNRLSPRIDVLDFGFVRRY